MKNLKSITGLFVLCLTVLTTSNMSAQETTSASGATENYDQGFRLGFGINGGFIFDDPYDFSLGADARIQYDLNQRYSITFTTGFTNLFIGDDIPDLGFIPAKAGFKAFVWENRFYVLGEVGAAIPVTNDYDKTSLLLAPGIGYANKYFDASIRYEYYNDFPRENGEGVGQLALRLAYGFRL